MKSEDSEISQVQQGKRKCQSWFSTDVSPCNYPYPINPGNVSNEQMYVETEIQTKMTYKYLMKIYPYMLKYLLCLEFYCHFDARKYKDYTELLPICAFFTSNENK